MNKIIALEIVELYSSLEKLDIRIWIDGGWGVDALLGEQSRPHEDVDIVIQQKDVAGLRELLGGWGYHDVERDDTRDWNFVLGDEHGHLVDVHAVVFDEDGNGLYGPVEKGVMYPAASLSGVGMIGGRPVRCLSPEWMVKFHSGYELDKDDYRDVSALCAKFGFDLPEEYAEFVE